MLFIMIILLISSINAKPLYPADSLMKSNEIPLIKKIGILPISLWQRISYNSNFFDCQFYPSCSNYGAISLKKHGLIRGGIIASDRITRCNPYALDYHMKLGFAFKDHDGRLIDPLVQNTIKSHKKSPYFASLLSVIPGLGRIYLGRPGDGFIGFINTFLTGNTAYYAIKNNRPIVGTLFSVAFFYVYFGEIYGTWRTAEFYQESNSISDKWN